MAYKLVGGFGLTLTYTVIMMVYLHSLGCSASWSQASKVSSHRSQRNSQMLFAIFGHDRNGALARRLEVRPQHLARIDQLVEENRIVIAGPLPKATDESSNEEGFHGSLIIGEFDSIEEARVGRR